MITSFLAWEQFFEKWDILLCPPSMVTAFPHCEPGSPLHVDDQEVIYWAVSGHGTLFNYTGHPAVVQPYKLDRDGLPLGIRSEEHTSELQSLRHLVCRLLLE